MDITEATYPVFEANQVLTNAHLNDLFEYLDEQTRLTRANLVGIGIVCGLTMEFNGVDTLSVTKGCGITSEGYLILEPADVDLIAVRPYVLPTDYGYPPFVDASAEQRPQYPLWELLTDDDEDDAVLLTDPLLGLEDKAVLLFLELRKDGQRTCVPNNCDDRGARVTATLRRLLVDVTDLKKILDTASTATTYLGADLTERLQLPDLRMPRFDVPNLGAVSTAQVLQAFQQCFTAGRLGLAGRTGQALSKLYEAFKPVVDDLFPRDPFSTFNDRFGFLDAAPDDPEQVLFMQYYWDLFDDLLAAYDELRWTGVELLCACCPPSDLFPRHLMVGVLDPDTFDTADYRHHFVRSPALGDCVDRSRRVRQLFHRLVAMLASFSEQPADRGIRVTPSRWGDVPLSKKAIPFYYRQDGAPPLYELWDPVRTAVRRANQNLGYRAGEYPPPTPAFVTEPLRYDLEPSNFLRIEGHLGMDVQSALKSLLTLRGQQRLPFEVVALRTEGLDEDIRIEINDADCRFRDLEALYDTLKAELDCFLVKQIRYFYALPLPQVAGEPLEVIDEPRVPILPVLTKRAPEFRAEPQTIGFAIESALSWKPGKAYPWIHAVAGLPDLPGQVYALVGGMSQLDGLLTDDLKELDLAAMDALYHRLVEIATRIEQFRRQGAFDAPGLSDRLDDLVFRCRLEPFAALVEEWRRRLLEAKQAQYLGHFLAAHPGIQHKAGVPLGGTFVLVYHQAPAVGNRIDDDLITWAAGSAPVRNRIDDDLITWAAGSAPVASTTNEGAASQADRRTRLAQALGRLEFKARFADDPDLGLVFHELTGRAFTPRDEITAGNRAVYDATVAFLEEGTVIADFFLPYICGPGCATVQYQLPPSKLKVATTNGCTNVDGFAEVKVSVDGGTRPLSVKVDDGTFEELAGPLLLSAGDHTLVVRDIEGSGSAQVPVHVPPTLRILDSHAEIDEASGNWQSTFTIDGGTPAFTSDVGTVVDRTFTGPVLKLAEVLDVTITDAAGCSVSARFESGVKPCVLPCGGEAVREGFRFWLPIAQPNLPLNDYTAQVTRFLITDGDGNRFDLSAEVTAIVNRGPNPIRTADFDGTVQNWMALINKRVADAVGAQDWVTFEYQAPEDKSTTGTLFVDRLRCVQFVFDLAGSYVQGRQQQRFQFGYSARGTVVVGPDDSKARIPVFAVTTSNKCRPDEPPVALCDGTDLAIGIRHDGAIPDPLTFRVTTAGDDRPVAFFWEIQDATPTVGNGDKVTAVFNPVEPVEKLVRVTAYTEKGCSVSREQLVDITKANG